jgi:hypothetical protein
MRVALCSVRRSGALGRVELMDLQVQEAHRGCAGRRNLRLALGTPCWAVNKADDGQFGDDGEGTEMKGYGDDGWVVVTGDNF